MVDSELTRFFVDKGVLVSIAGGVVYLVRYFFENVHIRITDLQAANDLKFLDLISRITAIESKYRDVLDIVIDKFSKWEDRIMGIVSKVGSVSPQEIQTEVNRFKKEAREDLETIKLRVEKVTNDVQKIVAEPVTEVQKNYLLERVKEQRAELENRIKITEENLSKTIKGLTVISLKQKEHEFKISNLIATRIVPSNKP